MHAKSEQKSAFDCEQLRLSARRACALAQHEGMHAVDSLVPINHAVGSKARHFGHVQVSAE